MANIFLCLSCLLCTAIRPAFLAPALINTTPFIEEWTTIVRTEATLTNDKDAQPSLADLINRVHDGRANDVNDKANINLAAKTELGSLDSSKAASTENPNDFSENVTLTETYSDLPVNVKDITSFNVINDDVSISTFSAVQSGAPISSSEKPWRTTSFSDVEEFNDVATANVTINEQGRLLGESALPNVTTNFKEISHNDKSSENNSTNSEQNRVIFVLPGPVNFSSHAIANVEDEETSSKINEPLKAEHNASSSVADNATETLNFNSFITVANGAIGGREEFSVTSTPLSKEDVSQEPTAPRDVNGSNIEEGQPSFNKTKNSSLVDDVEFVLSHGFNMSNSVFVNDLADLVSSISTMNAIALPAPEATPSGNSFNESESEDSATTEWSIANSFENFSKDQSEIEKTTSSSSSTASLNGITNSSWEETPVLQKHDNATSLYLITEPHSNFNDSTELNEIFSSSLEAKSTDGSVTSNNQDKEASIELVSTLHSTFNDSSELKEISDADSFSSPDAVTSETTTTSRSNFNEAELVTESLTEINTDLISTTLLNLVPSTEYADSVVTTEVENNVTTESAADFSNSAAETSNSTPDENLMQRNDISTETASRNSSENFSEIAPTESSDTAATVASTTVSGDELFTNTPLEYFINSTTITTLDLTTVASIVGFQGTPPHALLEIDNRHTPKTSCNHLGKEYATGQHVEQLDPCHFCVCVNGYLDCYWKNCPPPADGCVELDFEGVCHRSLYLCPIPKKGEPLPFPTNSIARIRREANYTQMTCDILGVQYRVGELIGVASDPCMECRCALDSLYCSPKCCFQPVEYGQDPSKNSRANDAAWQPVLAHPLKHLRYDFENQYST